MHQRTLVASLLVLCVPALVHARPAQFGEVEHVADISPTPGFPEGIAVQGHRVFVVTPASLGDNSNTEPSRVQIFHRQGHGLIGSYTVVGEDLSLPHNISGVALDAHKRLYVTSSQLGVIRFETRGCDEGQQELYSAAPPMLPPCPASGEACSPNPEPRPAVLNDLVFDEDGNLFVTDSAQATIWRIPAGGGSAEIFFQDARLGGFFGANGIRFDPERQRLYLTVSIGWQGGALYSLPLDDPNPESLQLLQAYPEVPDGVQIGRDGDIYVALAGSSQIAVLDPEAVEVERLPNDVSLATSPLPFDSPSGLAFDGRGWLYFTNHAVLSGNADNFAVLRVWVGDKGDRLELPRIP